MWNSVSMPRQKYEYCRQLVLVCSVIACLVIFRLFTVEVHYLDDPTVALAVRFAPGWSDTVLVSAPAQLDGLYLLVSDENDFPGSDLYRMLMSPLTWFGGLALAGAVVLRRYRRRS